MSAVPPPAPGFWRDQRGGVLPMVVLSLSVILGVAALAIDLGLQYALHAQLQTTADAAALAAASRLPNETKALKEAEEYAELNMPQARHGKVLNEDEVVFGTWFAHTGRFVPGGPLTNAVLVTVRRSTDNGNAAPTFFLPIFGRDHADLSAQALAGIVFFEPGPPGGEPSEEDRKRRDELFELLEQEQRRRFEKHGHDPDERMTEQEAFELLREDYGRAVLLR